MLPLLLQQGAYEDVCPINVVGTRFRSIRRRSIVRKFTDREICVPKLRRLHASVLFYRRLKVPLPLFRANRQLEVVDGRRYAVQRRTTEANPRCRLVHGPKIVGRMVEGAAGLILTRGLHPMRLIPNDCGGVLSPSMAVFDRDVVSVDGRDVLMLTSAKVRFSFRVAPSRKYHRGVR